MDFPGAAKTSQIVCFRPIALDLGAGEPLYITAKQAHLQSAARANAIPHLVIFPPSDITGRPERTNIPCLTCQSPRINGLAKEMPMLLSGVVLIDGLCIQQVLLSVSTIAPWFCECSVLGLFPVPRLPLVSDNKQSPPFLELVKC